MTPNPQTNTPDPLLGWLAWDTHDTSGYAKIATNFRPGLAAQGARFANGYTEDGDIELAICTPVRKLVRGLGKRPELVWHTMFEAEPLPPGWVDNLNAAGAVWVPSTHSFELFRESGVTVPMFKTPYGIDLNQYGYVNRSGRSGPMRFGIWADTIIGRKNVIKSVWAFIDAALPEAELEVKLHSFVGMNDRTAFADKEGRPLANVTLHVGSWPRPKLVKWLQSLDCMIYLSGGEGFGLMPLEAAATGCPVIVHNCTGMKEYLNSDAFLLVESNGKERAVSYMVGYKYPCVMMKPNYDQAVEQVRWAYNNREAAYQIGNIGHMQAQTFTWDNAAKLGWQHLKEYYATIR